MLGVLTPPSADGLNFEHVLRPPASTPAPGPYYDEYFSGNVTVLLGSAASLNCRVKQVANATVSWMRAADVPTLLSVGSYTYTMDNRFRVEHNRHTSDWTLKLERTTHNDSGVYDCQIGTTPPLTRHIFLTVVEPDTEILGGPEIFIDQQSTINLTCVIEHAPQPPDFILWEHDKKTINYDSERGGVSVVTTKGRTTVSQLLIRAARPPDSGRYTCRPASSKPASVRVHVLKAVSEYVPSGM
ncbi:LOW QUALITY PROTEIN: cell adhesion molecule 2-like [Pollicipes pollicipes]|uniref:LOW QUALITY PROTEIN: cell adhesion molecule 2-like n=1 Tax=Pollicipes pollicipes TaxID=41117 RepID=UPI0018849D46|nr:LOW QUALITY PROTEIN: cell adhesion molecule 2-like [Pollicipes pollicipes]